MRLSRSTKEKAPTFTVRQRGGAAVVGCCREARMPFVDTSSLNVVERLPGWYGRYFHSSNMTFAHYDVKRGSSIHEHFHPQKRSTR